MQPICTLEIGNRNEKLTGKYSPFTNQSLNILLGHFLRADFSRGKLDGLKCGFSELQKFTSFP
jgi:hypothetical protein